ncbi:Alcohol dehydrogenase superfamily, zinc-containing [Rhodopseudomonas palustris HaA2]|uniref:Alcohol dehydrogenase superfamily, zinc-containing n=1 Tax=Rhodopseudomonas palustris (strain HaA2) TaxID=316058 RepID=Q2ITG0_RHOP2|nr:zinc-binding dehydrogenase [Rhodopseudomonas palustris]ABD08500.1 Alcohol dehydrogenase superfamily, zinc-containing [Rhodopseudomonas palustris HaA2]
MPVTFRAAVLRELNRPLAIETVEAPPLAAGQVLVKLAYSGVCHSQVMEARGGRGVDRYLPHMLGHEGSGVVVETGAGVTKVKTGDRVILGWIKGKGADAQGIRYKSGDGFINAGAVTTFNEYAVVAENRVTLLPQGLPMDVAVLFGCALPVGAGIVINIAKPAPGSTLAVFGLGGIGLSALMACKLFDCRQLIAVDVEPAKLAMARELGATATIDASQQDPVAAIRELTGGLGVDYAIESAGLVRVIEQAFDATRRFGGLCVFASHPRSGEKIALDPFELICGKRILGTWGGDANPDRDVDLLAGLFRAGKLPLASMFSRRYALDEINIALDDLEQRRSVRPLIEIDATLG